MVALAVFVCGPHSRECREFGFVNMVSDRDSQQHIDALQKYEFVCHQLYVERAPARMTARFTSRPLQKLHDDKCRFEIYRW